MRITFLTYGTHGDVQPYASLALALAGRGHDVRLAAPSNFESLMRTFGLPYAALPGDTQALFASEEARRLLAAGQVGQLLVSLRQRLGSIRTQLEDAARDACKGAHIVAASSVTSFLGHACADAVGARLVLTELTPLSPASVAVTSVLSLEDVRALRQRWQLDAIDGNPDAHARAAGAMVLHGFSRQIVPRHKDWGPGHHVTGAWPLPPAVARSLPGAHADPEFDTWLREGPPPVYFGFGSLPVMQPAEMLALVRDVCLTHDLRAVIGAGWSEAATGPAARSARVFTTAACDHDWLFPRCAALLHHGGSGTIHAAARAGVPQIVCSVFSDQPFWGALLERHGVAVHLPFRQLDGVTLQAALTRVLADDVRQRAATLGEKVRAERGVEEAVEALEIEASRG